MDTVSPVVEGAADKDQVKIVEVEVITKAVSVPMDTQIQLDPPAVVNLPNVVAPPVAEKSPEENAVDASTSDRVPKIEAMDTESPVVEGAADEDQFKIVEVITKVVSVPMNTQIQLDPPAVVNLPNVVDPPVVEKSPEEAAVDASTSDRVPKIKAMDTESPVVKGAADKDQVKIVEVITKAVSVPMDTIQLDPPAVVNLPNVVAPPVVEKSPEEDAVDASTTVNAINVAGTSAADVTNTFACLVCNTAVEIPSATKDEPVNIDYVTLSSIYRVDVTSDEFDQKEKGNESFTQNQFCKNCLKEIELLLTFHTSMKMAVSKFDSQRDMIASRMFQTFLLNQEAVKQPIPPAKTGYQQEVLEKWKGMYTGKEDREIEVLRLVKERESRAAKISKRIAKVKSSLRRTGTFKPVPGTQPAKTMAQIQRAMTAAYFTPKLTILRKKNKHFLKVPFVYLADKSAQYICPICDKVFARKETMTIHTRSHVVSSGKLYKCSICDKICSDRQKLINHRKEHTEDQKNMKCAFCDKTFFRKGTLRNHLRTQHQKENFNCTICDKKFTSAILLKKHVASHSNIDFSVTDMFTCKTCSKSFLKSSDLNDHLRIHEDDSVQGCDFCGKAFNDEASLTAHREIHQGGNPYICESEDCGQRFASEALLNSHLKIHRPKDFTCEKCGKACRSRDGLRKHELTHTGKKPFNCGICDLGFIERKSYDAHMVKHTGKLPYQCNICKSEEGFKDAKDTRRHKVEHHPDTLPKDKSFACEFCWHGFPSTDAVSDHVAKVHERYKCHLCNRVFKLGDHLRRHMYIHTGEKPYPCTLCTKTFNQESNLKEHMYRHTGIRPHRCPYCPDIGYLRRMHLRDHMVKEHGTDKVPTLPMGRAAHNARRSEKRNVVIEGQQEAILGDIYSTSSMGEAVSVMAPAPEVIVPGIGGSSVYLKNFNLQNANAQKANMAQGGPLIMRTVSTAGMTNKAGQNPVFVRRIAQPGAIQGTAVKHDIPTINIKSETNVRFQTVMDAGDPNQQYIILL